MRVVKSVELVGLHREASSGAPLVLLREHDAPHRVLPIFVGGNEAVAIALALSDQPPPRPVTHDLMATLVETLDAHVDRVEVTELREGTFLAELAMTGPTGTRRIDSRPSDAIALAVRVDAPLFVSSAVLEEAGAILTEVPDEQAIEEEVARFRSLLDELDPTELPPTAPPEAPGEGGPESGPGPGPDDPSS